MGFYRRPRFVPPHLGGREDVATISNRPSKPFTRLTATFNALGAARVLASPTTAVRLTVLRATAIRCSRLGAALLLATLAAPVRLAVGRVAYSRLGAALVLAAPAASMRLAVPCTAAFS